MVNDYARVVKRSRNKSSINKRTKSIGLYFVMTLIAFLTLFPLLWAISASLRTDVELYKYTMPFSMKTLFPVDITFENYIRLFRQFHFFGAIVNTVVQVFILVPCGCLINSVAAFSFSFFNFKFKNTLFLLFMLSFMIPFESIALPLYNLISSLKWVDTLAAMIVPSVANGLVLFLFRQFFQDLPVAFLEAARVDGATLRQMFVKIVIPLSLPVFITAGLMLFITYWNSYLWPLLVARSDNIQTIQIALATLKMENETLWSCIYGGSVISAIIPLMMFLPFQKYFVEGITSSGVKG